MTDSTWQTVMALIYTTWTKLETPKDPKVKLIWKAKFKDVPDAAMMKACEKMIFRGGYPPGNVPGELWEILEKMAEANIDDNSMSTDEAFDYIRTRMIAFSGMGRSSLVAVYEHIKSASKQKHRYGLRKVPIVAERLIPLVKQWGVEIYQGSNISATRAQFRRAYEEISTHQKRKALLPGEKSKELAPNDMTALKDVVKQITSKIKMDRK